jgi:crotonobetainyl-CoA:carnitine CoA-transferase CaiB-like acyl-CoA transferase
LRPPWRFGGARPDRSGAAPRVGQDTRAIAAEVYDAARIDDLLAAGVLFADGLTPTMG